MAFPLFAAIWELLFPEAARKIAGNHRPDFPKGLAGKFLIDSSIKINWTVSGVKP